MSIPEAIVTEWLTDLSERGNILLVDPDSGINAWLRLGSEQLWLEVAFRYENYPALSINPLEISDAALAAHIVKTFGGTDWIVRKMNIHGVTVEHDRVKAAKETETEEDDS